MKLLGRIRPVGAWLPAWLCLSQAISSISTHSVHKCLTRHAHIQQVELDAAGNGPGTVASTRLYTEGSSCAQRPHPTSLLLSTGQPPHSLRSPKP